MVEKKSAEILEEKKDDKKADKKNPLQKLKENFDDKEEQANAITTLIKIVVLGWSGAILTLNYVSIPGIPQQKIDPTFIASVFTGVLASFNIATASKKGDGTMKMNGDNNGQITKKDMEAMIAKAASTAAVQTVRIEQAPLVIKAETPSKDSKYQM
tara:strand:- start:1363 stop:1830 length:468 start_codon:yes stop_codon:yes gene_type:complete